MVTLFDKTQNASAAGNGGPQDSYSGYREPDTKVPPRARPVLGAISVNGVAIAESDILAEAQNHPADNPGAALAAAARALVVRQLLLQRARELDLLAAPQADGDGRLETAEDAAIRLVIEREVSAPSASEEECRRFYDNNREKFRSAPIFEASHILLPADPTDEVKADQKDFFRLLYHLLVAADRGPRLPTLVVALGEEKVRTLLGA